MLKIVALSLAFLVFSWMGFRFARRVIAYYMVYRVLYRWGYPPPHFEIEDFADEVYNAREIQADFQRDRALSPFHRKPR